MPTQSSQFNTAFANLTPEEQKNYTTANPNVNTNAGGIPITKDVLTANQTPITLPIIPPPTYTAPPIVASPAGTTVDTNGNATVPPPPTTPVTPEKTTLQKFYDKLGISSDVETLGTKGAVTTQLQNDNKLAEKTLAATTDYNTYNQTKIDLQNKIDKISNNPLLTKEQAQQQTAEISRIGNSNLANLAIQAQASQGLLSAAEKTIKDKIEAQFQPIQDKIDYTLKLATASNNDLTDSERFQLQEKADALKADKTNLTKISDDLHQNILANAPTGERASLYASLDKISNDFASGKITAPQASSQMYQIAGKYGVSVQDQATKANTAKTYNEIANNELNLSNKDTQATLDGDVQDVLTGRNTIGNIRLQMGRTKDATNYLTNLRNKVRGIDPSFDFVASDAGSKFISSTYYQKAVSAINSVLPNINNIIEYSNQVPRLGIKGVDALLQKGNLQINNEKVANFREAQKLIADEIGVALGAGTVSDMKLQLGFDVTDPTVSPEVFASNMNVVKGFLQNRVDGLNKQRYQSSTVNNTSPTNTESTPAVNDFRTKYGY